MLIDSHQHVFWHYRNDADLVADMDAHGIDLAWLLTWEEVNLAAEKRDILRLTFESEEVIRRYEKHGDLFAPVLKMKQKLPHV